MIRAERDRLAALEASKASQAKAKRENAKHTPGPWEPIKLDSAPLGLWAVNAPGHGGRNPLVCGMEYSKGGPILHAESEANARLIAAAPELLDALDGLAAQVRPLLTELDIDGFRHSALKEAYDFACKVAGKAQGEPQ